MKNSIFFLFALLFLPFSCETPEKEEEVIYGSIEGYLYLDYRNNPYVGVDVMLSPGPHITLTDSKGYYRLGNIKEGNYTMSLYYSRDFIDEFPIYIPAGHPSRLDMMYFSPQKPNLPDLSVVDISSEGVGWDYWVVGKNECLYIDKENSKPKSVLYHSFPEDRDYLISFNEKGLPSSVSFEGWVFLFNNFNGSKVDLGILSPSNEVWIVREIQTDFVWPASFPVTKSTQSKADFIKWTGRIIGAIPCVTMGASAFVTGGAAIPLALWTCGNYFLSLTSSLMSDADVHNGFTEFIGTYSLLSTYYTCSTSIESCLLSLANKALNKYADYVEELEVRAWYVSKLQNLLEGGDILNTIILQPGAEGKDTYLMRSTWSDCSVTDSNYPNDPLIGFENSLGDGCKRSQKIVLLEFKLSLIPVNAIIKSAELKVYGYAVASNTNSTKVSLHILNSSWSELGVSWENQPESELISKLNFDINFENSWHSWDVTNIVQDWVSGRTDNFGFKILTLEDKVYGDIYSSDNEDTEHRPKLIIEYY